MHDRQTVDRLRDMSERGLENLSRECGRPIEIQGARRWNLVYEIGGRFAPGDEAGNRTGATGACAQAIVRRVLLAGDVDHAHLVEGQGPFAAGAVAQAHAHFDALLAGRHRLKSRWDVFLGGKRMQHEIYAARKSDHDHGVSYEPMAWLIDEAALMPLRSLPGVLAEGRGYGLRVLLCGQSFGAFRERWGDRGADTIRDAASTSVLWGGLHDDVLLGAYERIGGTHWVRHKGAIEQSQGGWQSRWSAHRIAHLPRRKVLIFNGVSKPRLIRAAYPKRMWACQHALEQAASVATRLHLLRVRLVLVIVVSALLLIFAHTVPLLPILHHLHIG
jgi:TraM recognition site of TraD and TraG